MADNGKPRGKLKTLLWFTAQHLNPFSGASQEQASGSQPKSYLQLLRLRNLQRYFAGAAATGSAANTGERVTRSAPATPLRTNNTKPSVRFVVDSMKEEESSDEKQSDILARLFKLEDALSGDRKLLDQGESPMDSAKFKKYGYSLIDYIANYLDTIDQRRVTPVNLEPGYLRELIEMRAPEKGESFARIMHDFERHIMCGITHWQHPHFHAYFPAGNAYPSILANLLSDALGCVGFSWAASPAYTELEIIMTNWMGQMIGLPEEFLSTSEQGKGGGVIQGSASECVLVNLLAARHGAMERLRKRYPQSPDGLLLGKLIGYCSKEAHSCVEKAAMIGFIRMRALETDEHHSLRGETVRQAMRTDMAQGLEPFIVCATLGTTSCVSFDNIDELGDVCQEHQVWLHVDAAYAGSALICPEFKYLIKGIEKASSFNMNPNKWMLINFDCSLMWVKDKFMLTRAFVVDPLYLQHSFSNQSIDYRHWGIPLSRRFRALKLWFVIRNYGIEGLQQYIRNHVKLAKLFEQLIRADRRFLVTNDVVLGLVCFRLIGSNALNQRLLSMINASGKLHMVPASVNGVYVIRFCVCDKQAKEADIIYAYECISQFATDLLEAVRLGKERFRAISQQNTIDVSSMSQHRQQSASANDSCKLNGSTDHELANSREELNSNAETGSEANSVLLAAATGHKGQLTKQASIVAAAGHCEQVDANPDSLATIDDLDYDLDELDDDDDDDGEDAELERLMSRQSPERLAELEAAAQAQGQAKDSARLPLNHCQSMTVARQQWGSRAGRRSRQNQTMAAGELDELDDQVRSLAERRQRMSLRYKRQFFVRVVSDPRVYRASISGDINAHSSSGSLATSGPAGANSSAGELTGNNNNVSNGLQAQQKGARQALQAGIGELAKQQTGV